MLFFNWVTVIFFLPLSKSFHLALRIVLANNSTTFIFLEGFVERNVEKGRAEEDFNQFRRKAH